MHDTNFKVSMHQWLHLGSCWRIDTVETHAKKGRVDIYISHSGKDLVCPDTGEPGTLYDHRKERQWRHLDLFHFKCFIHCRIPRVLTREGPKTITIPWAAPSSRVTYAFERFAIRLLKATKNQTKTADLLRCGFNQINRMMHRAVERGESRRSLAGIRHISLDEKALKRGHTYATIVSDSDRGVVIDVGLGRTKKGTIELLESILEHMTDQIETVSTDMWKAFIGAVAKVFPKALLIHDRFHLIQYLNKAINQVRRREVKQHPELKGSRYALLKNSRTKKQEDIFQVVKQSNLNVSVAWRLREDFKAIFECASFKEAKAYFNLWLDEVQEAGVKEVMKIADMFKNHFDGVCNALWNRQSNAKAERINGKIQEVKTIGRGYRTFENFRVAILFFCGGLDLYPHDS